MSGVEHCPVHHQTQGRRGGGLGPQAQHGQLRLGQNAGGDLEDEGHHHIGRHVGQDVGEDDPEHGVAGELGEVDASAVHDRPSPERSLINFRDFVAGYAKRQKEAPVKILPVVDESLCNGCGLCAGACPTDAIVNPSGEVDGSKCIKCCACVKVCPSSARSLSSPFAPVLSENFNKRKEPVWLVG